ncbi:MAG: NADP-dependent oxidoreductase [Proteobacteria bacterium]|nr:NADP-dependent oxidoreductase [Pseudomonadota bacterium]
MISGPPVLLLVPPAQSFRRPRRQLQCVKRLAVSAARFAAPSFDATLQAHPASETRVPSHRQILYVRPPSGMPDASCFELVEAPAPVPAAGQVLVATHYLSIDPYFRRMMGGGHGQYANPLKPGDVMVGRGAGVVIESRHPDFKPGDGVQGEFGWRELVVRDGEGLRKLPPDLKPLSLSLGAVGQSGATAIIGLVEIANIKAGETLVVSAAAGAVGSVAGQYAKAKGCRAIGIAGGVDKCRHVVSDLGFDDCIDYKAGPIGPALTKAAPGGVDVYFDNVGGDILDAMLLHLNQGARVPVCGQISQYNATARQGLKNAGAILDKCLTIRGFRVGTDLRRRDQALDELMDMYRAGRLRYRETVAEGLEAAPAALVNMLSGGNIGKQVVRLAAAR